jgi:hypothetical protein
MHHSTPRFALSEAHIALIIYKLRNANNRYASIAEKIRATTKNKSCRAYRMRAAWLGLQVDIGAALALCEAQVSKIPLPILDTTMPTPAEPIILSPPHYVPSITMTAPTPIGLTDIGGVDKLYSQIPPIRIPSRGPFVNLSGMDRITPRAPLLKLKELPAVSPEIFFGNLSPMSLDSGVSFLDHETILLLNHSFRRFFLSLYTRRSLSCQIAHQVFWKAQNSGYGCGRHPFSQSMFCLYFGTIRFTNRYCERSTI